ncbi:hypothetical protein [Acinetobacter johnsonii]|uniref:hypothetical protein n=1 Tax=Acinetobacter johnsonii TaxID=40214 RepID=UPI001F1D3DA2|nr:hypothetical protein [Acinetobacter johnsonii]
MHFANRNAGLLILGALLTQQSYAIDVNVGDYTTLPSGTNLGVFYYQHSEMDGYYQKGDKTHADSRSDIGIARFIHYTDRWITSDATSGHSIWLSAKYSNW